MMAIQWTSTSLRWTAFHVEARLLPQTCTAPQAHIGPSAHRLSLPNLTVTQLRRIATLTALRTAPPHPYSTPIGALRGSFKERKLNVLELHWNVKMWTLREHVSIQQEVFSMWRRRVVSPNGLCVVQGNGGGGVDSGLNVPTVPAQVRFMQPRVPRMSSLGFGFASVPDTLSFCELNWFDGPMYCVLK